MSCAYEEGLVLKKGVVVLHLTSEHLTRPGYLGPLAWALLVPLGYLAAQAYQDHP